jgi:hypothetical protein
MPSVERWSTATDGITGKLAATLSSARKPRSPGAAPLGRRPRVADVVVHTQPTAAASAQGPTACDMCVVEAG